MIPAYSISKPFLAQAVLELGLPLDSTIGEHLPNLAPVYASRRLDQLLNHTSGLADYSALPDYNRAVENLEPAWPATELLARAESLNHNQPSFQYSNIGYLLLLQLVEAKTGLAYFAALNRLVFEPLGIQGVAEWSQPHDSIPDYDPGWVYSGTFLAAPAELASNLVRLAKHREGTIGLATGGASVPYANTGFDYPTYGFGFMMDTSADRKTVNFVGHGGGGPGFQLFALVNTRTWQADIRVENEPFDQTAAILDLKSRLAG